MPRPPPSSPLFPYTTLFRSPGALRIAVSSAFPAGVRGRLAPEVSGAVDRTARSEEHTSELQSHVNLVCRLLLEKKKKEAGMGSGSGQRVFSGFRHVVAVVAM